MAGLMHATMAVILTPLPHEPGQRGLTTAIAPDVVTFELAVLPDGSLEACVKYPNEKTPPTFRSRILAVTAPQRVTFVVWRMDNEVGIAIEGATALGEKPLRSIEDALPMPLLSAEHPPLHLVLATLPTGLSTADPNALATCLPAMQRRARQYSAPPSNKPNNRPATTKEQLDQLKQAIQDLEDLTQSGRSGKLSHFKYIASELRNLVFWKEDKKGVFATNYDPLLFRLAHLGNLPLPVFTVPKLQIPDWKKSAQSGVFLRTKMPKLVRSHVEDELIDFQDWLLEDAIEVWPVLGGGNPELRSVKGIVLLTSVALGGSHYERLVPQDLDLFKTIQSKSLDGLQSLLLGLSQTVISLGEHVAKELESRNIGT